MKNLGTRVQRASLGLERTQSLASRLLGDGNKVAAAMQTFYSANYPLSWFIDLPTWQHMPGIFLAVLTSCEILVSCRQASGGDLNVTNCDGQTPLTVAVSGGDLRMDKALIDSGADANARDVGGYTALLQAADRHWLEGGELLLRKGADPHARNMEKQTCLHVLSLKQFESPTSCDAVIDKLLEAGIGIDARYINGSTPLLLATERARPPV